MEDKMKWAKNYERVQEITRQLSWPPVTDLDPRVYIPEASMLWYNEFFIKRMTTSDIFNLMKRLYNFIHSI